MPASPSAVPGKTIADPGGLRLTKESILGFALRRGRRFRLLRTGIAFDVSPTDRHRLAAGGGDRNSAQKQVWRCRIVLLTDAGAGTRAIRRATGVSKTAVWRWQKRFMTQGVGGLLRDRTRPWRIAPLKPDAGGLVMFG